jgi:WhiB family redox-sensing transcriptional regulator
MTAVTRIRTPRADWSWTEDAVCGGEDAELFFAPDGEQAAERAIREQMAKVVCTGCPVRRQCLRDAVNRKEAHGVWGGIGEDELVSYRRRQTRRSRAA